MTEAQSLQTSRSFIKWLADSPGRVISPAAIALGHCGGALSAAGIAQQVWGNWYSKVIAVTALIVILEFIFDPIRWGFSRDTLYDSIEYGAGYLLLISGYAVLLAALAYVLFVLLPVQYLRFTGTPTPKMLDRYRKIALARQNGPLSVVT